MNFSATWQFWPIEKKVGGGGGGGKGKAPPPPPPPPPRESPEVKEGQKCEDTMDWRKHAYLPPTPFPIHTSNKLREGL